MDGRKFTLTVRLPRLRSYYEPKILRAGLLGFAAGLAVALLLKADPSPLVDHFYARQAERQVMRVWMRRAAPIDYRGCRARPENCVGRIVAWRLSHPAQGDSRYQDDASNPISWRNEAQVPYTLGRGAQFVAVSLVAGVSPKSIKLVFVGTPDSAYAGTTWKDVFGLLAAPRKERLIP
ncbi:MAG: hypothetical protein KGO96_02105 [Elusimicrobia bacterium]|nr:hypothetical protein [Elusimicrobiota bacterium]MDE2236651.1 hypothetical protein [Elusimicrobiota bacterium]MDE2424689.1 hypothetical protein [Elusimicrobiota bacterium]